MNGLEYFLIGALIGLVVGALAGVLWGRKHPTVAAEVAKVADQAAKKL